MRIAGLILLLCAAGMPLQAQTDRELELTIDEPADWRPAGTNVRGITVAARTSIRVSGTARHPNGIAELLLDGNRASIVPQGDGSVRFVGYVLVREKMTSAEITAVTPAGERDAVKFAISPTAPPMPAATPDDAWIAASEGFQGKRWAVVIGVSDYQDPEIQGLQYADRDAKAFYDFLRSDLAGMGGFAPENIQILLNEDATYVNMKVALFDFLKNALEEDVVYIYFAGHGTPDPQRNQNLYLLPYDANSKQLGGTGFPMEDMNRALRDVRAKHKILITDACHSGGINTPGLRALTLNEINSNFLNAMISSEGVHATLTASRANEYSREGDEWGGGHGVFTYYLLEALRGAADIDRDHIVSINEAFEYTRDQVRRGTNGEQTPGLSETAFNRMFPVSLVLPGTEIPEIPFAEVRQAHAVSTVMARAFDSQWIPDSDSLLTVAGTTDTIIIRLANERRDIIPGKMLTWTTGNPAVATVENGVVTGHGGGVTQVKAEARNRSIVIDVRVVPRPTEVHFSPVEDVIDLVQGETLNIRTDLLLGERWLRGVTPRLSAPDSVVLEPASPGQFIARRPGETRLAANVGGWVKEWTVRVIEPNLRIKQPASALPVGDSIRLGAWRTRPDGTQLGDAANVIWRTSDSTRAVIREDMLHLRGIGRVTVHAFAGTAQDSLSVFVLGDVLVGVHGRLGETILSVSLRSGEAVPLLPRELKASQPALSPDGQSLVFVSDKRLHIARSDGSDVRRLTPDMKGILGIRASRYEEHSPSWTYDGERIVFSSNAPGNYEIFAVRPDGTDVQRLTDDGSVDRNVSAAPDLPRIAFERVTSSTDANIVLSMPDGTQQVPLTDDVPAALVRFSERKPKFIGGSPAIAFVRRPSNRDGETLALLDTESKMVLKDLVKPVKDHAIMYAVSPDGQRIIYHQLAEWGRRNSSIALIDLEGTPIKNINLGNDIRVNELSWGAHLIQNNPEGR